MEKPVIYTVGHSTHQLDHFLEILKEHNVNCIVDVRSVAASAYNPQYNKEPFTNFLKNNGIAYLHFDKEFGARHTDYRLLDDKGRVDFEKVQKSAEFNRGIQRLRQGLDRGFNISLMCSESEPLDCHRFSMVSIALERSGFSVLHILKDKTIKTNAQLEMQLLKKYDKKLPKPTMFEPDVTLEDQLKVAYRLRNDEIGFSAYSTETEERYD